MFINLMYCIVSEVIKKEYNLKLTATNGLNLKFKKKSSKDSFILLSSPVYRKLFKIMITNIVV